MKNFGLKIATLVICLPALALASGVRKSGATRANLVKGKTKAEVATALADANIIGIDADALNKALSDNIISAEALNTIINNDSGKLEDSTRTNVLKLVAAEADATMVEAIPGSKLKLEGARKKIVSLAVEVDGGSTHNQSTLNSLATTFAAGYTNSKLPSETIAALEAELNKTATAEAKAEAESTGKSLVELFAKCD